MNNIETFYRLMLWVHIAGGTSALINGLGSILTTKGSRTHRTFGKIYFWSMTGVFVSALILAIGHQRTFLLMLTFFSYYFTVRGYRILYLKNLGLTQQATWIDWMISAITGVFMIFLCAWGIHSVILHDNMGIVALVFAAIGTASLVGDMRQLNRKPTKFGWWYGHIARMGASYISATTAFVVVNISIPGFNWLLWILPSIIGGAMISLTIRSYRMKFEKKVAN